MTGDLNLDKLRWDTPEKENENMTERTKLDIESRGFHQYVRPGRTSTLIDHSWSNKTENIIKASNSLQQHHAGRGLDIKEV